MLDSAVHIACFFSILVANESLFENTLHFILVSDGSLHIVDIGE